MTSLEQVRREAIDAGYGAVWDVRRPQLMAEWDPGDYWQRFELDYARHRIRAVSERSGGPVTDEFILVRADGSLVAELRRAVEAVNQASADPNPWLFDPPPSAGAIEL